MFFFFCLHSHLNSSAIFLFICFMTSPAPPNFERSRIGCHNSWLSASSNSEQYCFFCMLLVSFQIQTKKKKKTQNTSCFIKKKFQRNVSGSSTLNIFQNTKVSKIFHLCTRFLFWSTKQNRKSKIFLRFQKWSFPVCVWDGLVNLHVFKRGIASLYLKKKCILTTDGFVVRWFPPNDPTIPTRRSVPECFKI